MNIFIVNKKTNKIGKMNIGIPDDYENDDLASYFDENEYDPETQFIATGVYLPEGLYEIVGNEVVAKEVY